MINALIILACALITISGLLVSYSKNKDPFSPIKIFTAFNFVFYFDVYVNKYDTLVLIIYFVQCFMILVFSLFEPYKKNSEIEIQLINYRKAIFIVWLLTVIPGLTQLYVISELGGISQTIANIAFRVKYFEGKGYLIILNSFMIVLNILHFQISIQSKKIKFLLLYVLHFFILVLVGLLSGSRSFIAMTILATCVVYNYQVKKIDVSKLILMALLLISLVGLLGQVRNTVTTENDEISLRDSDGDKKFESSHFKYGLIPLEIIAASELKNLQYGKTYFSLLTNFVPRAIFEEKPDSGGIFFTREYADNAWGGDSNLATGTVTEGIINFGWGLGSIFGFLLLFVMYFLGISAYKIYILSGAFKKNIFILIPYVYFILLVARYSYSEFSYIFFSFFLTIFLPSALFYFFYKIKF